MGFMKHDAIVVTSFQEEHIKSARAEAEDLELVCTDIAASPVNYYFTFLIVPDGSKESWPESRWNDARREEWKLWANKSDLYLDWVHVEFGGDAPELSKINEHNASRHEGDE
jgi:hypothetical protein